MPVAEDTTQRMTSTRTFILMPKPRKAIAKRVVLNTVTFVIVRLHVGFMLPIRTDGNSLNQRTSTHLLFARTGLCDVNNNHPCLPALLLMLIIVMFHIQFEPVFGKPPTSNNLHLRS